MSASVILTPLVIAAWPAFSTAVVAAAGAMGYTVAKQAAEQLTSDEQVAQIEKIQQLYQRLRMRKRSRLNTIREKTYRQAI